MKNKGFFLLFFVLLIFFFISISGYSASLVQVEFVIGAGSNPPVNMGYPVGITTDGIYIYVTDWELDKIFVFSKQGKLVRVFPSPSSGYTISKPVGIAVGKNKDLYVVSQGKNKILIISRTGKVKKGFAKGPGKGEGELNGPRGIAIDKYGNVYVVDTNNSRIVKFNSEGKYLFSFGREGGGKGEFYKPRGIGIDHRSYIYVADTFHSKVQVFTLDGVYKGEFGRPGKGKGQFARTRYISFDRKNDIYVSDYNNGRVQVFSKEGRYLYTIGEGFLSYPEGVLVDGNYLWVCDAGNSRVVKFKLNFISSTKAKAISKFKERKWKEALKLFKETLQEDPQDLESHKYLALIYAKLDRWKDAVDEYEYLFSHGMEEVKSDLVTSLYSLSLYYYKNKEYRKSLSVLDRLISLDPNNKDLKGFYKKVKFKSMIELLFSSVIYYIVGILLFIIIIVLFIRARKKRNYGRRIYRKR